MSAIRSDILPAANRNVTERMPSLLSYRIFVIRGSLYLADYKRGCCTSAKRSCNNPLTFSGKSCRNLLSEVLTDFSRFAVVNPILICCKSRALNTLNKVLLAEQIHNDQRSNYHYSAGVSDGGIIQILTRIIGSQRCRYTYKL